MDRFLMVLWLVISLLWSGMAEARGNGGKKKGGDEEKCTATWCTQLTQGKHYYKLKQYGQAIDALERAAADPVGGKDYGVLFYLSKAHYDRFGGSGGATINDDIGAALKYAAAAVDAPGNPDEQGAAEALLADLKGQFVAVPVVPAPGSKSKLECQIIGTKKGQVYRSILDMINQGRLTGPTTFYFPIGADCSVGSFKFKTEKGVTISEVFVPTMGGQEVSVPDVKTLSLTGLFAYTENSSQDSTAITGGLGVKFRGWPFQAAQIKLEGWGTGELNSPLNKIDGAIALLVGASFYVLGNENSNIALLLGLNAGGSRLMGPGKWGAVVEGEAMIEVLSTVALGVSPRAEFYGDLPDYGWYPVNAMLTIKPLRWR